MESADPRGAAGGDAVPRGPQPRISLRHNDEGAGGGAEPLSMRRCRNTCRSSHVTGRGSSSRADPWNLDCTGAGMAGPRPEAGRRCWANGLFSLSREPGGTTSGGCAFSIIPADRQLEGEVSRGMVRGGGPRSCSPLEPETLWRACCNGRTRNSRAFRVLFQRIPAITDGAFLRRGRRACRANKTVLFGVLGLEVRQHLAGWLIWPERGSQSTRSGWCARQSWLTTVLLQS
jgi:hypothetical protein